MIGTLLREFNGFYSVNGHFSIFSFFFALFFFVDFDRKSQFVTDKEGSESELQI